MVSARFTCERCNAIVKKVITCVKCRRFVCDNCRDEYSGLCIDCTKKVAEDPNSVLSEEIEN